VVFDCVGSSESLAQSLAMVKARGKVVMVGMPGKVSIDLAPLWHRELTVVGAYAYGSESIPPDAEPRRSFELAIDLVAAAGLGSLVSAAYPLERYEEAIGHAGAAGRRGATKVVFDLRTPKGTTR
jgi:threonine dehydrogenase-like Zn-dependent dehydrogenase